MRAPDDQVGDGERVLWTSRPAPVSVAVGPLFFWITLLVAALLGAAVHDRLGNPVLWPLAAGAIVVFAFTRLSWEVAGWFATRYTLTDRRVVARFGVLSRVEVEIPLHQIQHVSVVRLLRDRVVGVGSVGIDSAGSGGTEVWWVRVADAEEVAGKVREAMKTHARTPPARTPPGETHSLTLGARFSARPIVVGLTGSIGGGKSTAAGILQSLGCLVIDSDTEAKAALDRPEVKASLVAWWGAGIVDAGGKVDRKAVATIVFAKPEERDRLERLVHPLVRKSREGMIERAAAEGASMVVVDVPLLYEAGVDAECDAVMFVDAPREVRLARVAGRGWDEAELARREAAQWAVENKKRRADERIENGGSVEELRRAVTEAAERIKARPRRPSGGRG
jgi:dephospho-CoA kinase